MLFGHSASVFSQNTGTLLYDTHITANQKLWQDRIHDEAGEFQTLCTEQRLVPALWDLYEWSNWMTPLIGIKRWAVHMETRRICLNVLLGSISRFDTAFYLTTLDSQPTAMADRVEVDGFMVSWSVP